MTTTPSRRRNDTGSMPLAMLITVVGVLLSSVLASTMSVQVGSTRHAVQRQHALDAAQAGLDVVVGQIRTATDGTYSNGFDANGVLNKLPCGPVIGAVGVGGTATYSVTISYSSTKSGAAIACHGIKGPAYAHLTAKGIDVTSAISRTLRATYSFRTTNKNIPGGLLRIYRTATSKDLCTAASGTAVVVQTCSTGSTLQTFAYNPNLTITLVSTITDAMPLGKCIDAGPVPHTTNNAAVSLQPCGAVTLPRQQWSFNDTGNLEGTSNGTSTDATCLNVQSPDSIGSAIVLKIGANACYESYNNVMNFNPDATMGAGAAGPDTDQLVNYKQFGRCLDVPKADWTWNYLSAWPCKQKPDPTQVKWNQKWTTPALAAGASSATGTIYTHPDNTAFTTCLTSPATTGPTSFVDLTQCPAGAPPATMKWTVYGDTGVYATSYTIVNGYGNCMSASDPDDPSTVFHTSGNKISTVIVLPCTGSLFQKWNADPFALRPRALTDISEQ